MEKSVSAPYSSYNPLVLAYMGDSYYETLVRCHLIGSGDCLPAELNKAARLYVTASAQSKAVNAVLPLLTESETSVYKAGRNAKSSHSSKSAEIGDYRRATGLEALFGWLYISGDTKRAEELFFAITSSMEKCEEQ